MMNVHGALDVDCPQKQAIEALQKRKETVSELLESHVA